MLEQKKHFFRYKYYLIIESVFRILFKKNKNKTKTRK